MPSIHDNNNTPEDDYKSQMDIYMDQMKSTMMLPINGNTIYSDGTLHNFPPEPSQRERQAFVLIKLGLLIDMKALTNKEAGKIVAMSESPDLENMTLAEEIIKQKFAEL